MVKVSRLLPARRDRVKIDVKQLRRQHSDRSQSTFLLRLAQGDREQVRIAIRMATQLQPPV